MNDNKPKPPSYRDIVKPMLEKSEGFRDSVYYDSKNIPTIGFGTNLKDPANVEMMKLNGIDVDELYRGRTLNPEQATFLKDRSLDRKEKELRSHISDDMFDNLTPDKQASLMSLMYNSRNLIGPKLRENLASGDDLATAREILAYSNPKNELGTLVRRSDEASKFIGDNEEQLIDLFRLLNDDERSMIQSVLDKSDNAPVKQEYLDKYGKYLNLPQPLSLKKLLD